jgi:hypothetical protein
MNKEEVMPHAYNRLCEIANRTPKAPLLYDFTALLATGICVAIYFSGENTVLYTVPGLTIHPEFLPKKKGGKAGLQGFPPNE